MQNATGKRKWKIQQNLINLGKGLIHSSEFKITELINLRNGMIHSSECMMTQCALWPPFNIFTNLVNLGNGMIHSLECLMT